uniref:AN1-type domain-containing protein n=1 Tax=Monopterus albus TaxID=43700 RepID=A0A3Q3K9G2_MONAL
MTNRKEPPFFNDDSVGAFHYKLPFYDTMELFIETLTGTCFELRVLPFEAVISVKAKIQRLEGTKLTTVLFAYFRLLIAEGCTLKLVLAMRGGPINTRKVTMEDPIKEAADPMESTKETGWEKSLTNKQVTFVVYREGDQLNFFRVVDKGDGTLTPLSESLSGGSLYNVYTEEEDGEHSAAVQQSLENSITMNKMKLLKAKMEDMNLNKKPKKSTKVKPRPPVSPHPCGGSIGPSSTRHHHRLFHALPQINQSRQSNPQLPPIIDHESIDPSSSSAATAAAHMSIARRPPPSFSSSSCYMLQEEEPWETCPPFAKIRPPPKVSRLDIGSTRLMRDCVYPQLPPLASLGKLSDSLNLDVPTQPEGGCRSGDIGAQRQLPVSPSPLSTWTLGTSDTLTSSADRTQLGTSFHIGPPSQIPASTSPSTSTRPLPQPFDSTLSCLQSNLQAQSSAHVKPGDASLHPSTSSIHPPRFRGIKVESPGKRPELISKREARGITKMTNQSCTEPVASLSNSELLTSLSTRAPNSSSRDSLREPLGLAVSLPPPAVSGQGRLGSKLPFIPTNSTLAPVTSVQMFPLLSGTPTYHLPPVKAPTGNKKKSSKYCFLCGKKTGLATSYECRCGHNFCATHRYAETHDCTYDYKSAGRRFLQETNPLISAPKLPKI